MSGWEDATDTVYRIDQQSVDNFQLLGLNSTNTDFYPAGTGTGTASKISNFQEIPQVLTISTTGGDPRFTTISPIARRKDQEATLIGLGLNKRHRSRELEDTPSVRGMINKVRHLVRVDDDKAA